MSEVTGISRTSIQRILKHYKWHPYKIQLFHELNEDDHDRLSFCVSRGRILLLDINMARLTLEQRIFILRHYFESKSFKTVKERFSGRFQNVNAPAKSTLLRLVNKFDRSGDVRDEQRSGRKIVAVNRNSQTSRRRRATRLVICPRTVGRCLKKLKMKPYRLSCMQELLLADYERR
nr:unnamed protein product [Callosobruchus chinensis]